MSRISGLLVRLGVRPAPAPRAGPPLFVPHGHFYSPIVDPQEIRDRAARIWPESPVVAGIDFNDESHRDVLTRAFPRFIGDYRYPDTRDAASASHAFFNHNPQFAVLDSRALFVMLRDLRPRRVIEVGSGYSSLLMADVNERFLGSAIDITCIEPYPPAFLKAGGLRGIARVVERKVQDVPVAQLASLEAGDILFIDSSHVSKMASDVNFLYFEVLPALRPGVIVHIHDVFLPHDYPREWVLVEGRNWNEQYLVRALLMYSRAFRVRFGCSYAWYRFPDLVSAALRGEGYTGSSLWIEVLEHA